MISLREYKRRKILEITPIVEEDSGKEEEIIFVNDLEKIYRMKVVEYGTWYSGDGDKILNFYTRAINIDYNYEPFFDRNKRDYFWAVSATEEGIKRTHSGIAKTIVDTLTGICGEPKIKSSYSDWLLQEILEENNFYDLYSQVQMPMTMVEGWGAYKINWDMSISDYPMIKYYKANDVNFIEREKRIIGIMFKDFYTDSKRKYLVVETRYIKNGNLYIDKDGFEAYDGDDAIKPIELKSIPGLKDAVERIEVSNYNGLLAVPCRFFRDVNNEVEGRSIYEGKVDLFDDYDQCFSQRSNTVRRSTPMEYFDTEYLERDMRTGIPIQPKVYDRKYTWYKGARNADGGNENKLPVTVTQPKIDFLQYDGEATAILAEIIDGILSPASLGIDLARKDNADAQREKEKVTVFTRNKILKQEIRILTKLMIETLRAYELMHKGEISFRDYEVDVEFSEFADDSYENKLQALGTALSLGAISPKMYLNKLYGNTLSEAEFKEELEYLESRLNEENNPDDEDSFGIGSGTDKEDNLELSEPDKEAEV